jgi:hypothetical protein
MVTARPIILMSGLGQNGGIMKALGTADIRYKNLSNLQIELLTLYQTDVDDDSLKDIRRLLKIYFAKKAIAEADKVWSEKGYSDDDMDAFLSEAAS